MAEKPIDKSKIIDEGAITSIIADFEKLIGVLGRTDDAIKKIAEDTGEIKPPKNTEDFAKIAEQIRKLEAAYKAQVANTEALRKAQENLANATREHNNLLKGKVNLGKKDENQLVKIQTRIDNYKKSIATLNKDLKIGNITEAESIRIKTRLNVQLKQAQKEYREVERTVFELTKEQKKEQEQAKARVAIRTIEVKSIEDAVAMNKELRIILSALDVTTKEGQLARKELTDEIDKNTEFIKNNTDAYSRQKMEVGNYTQSITNALKETNLFSTGIAGLDKTLNAILARMINFTARTKAQKKAIQENSKAMGGLSKAVRGVGTALKAAGIGLALAAIAGIVAMFKQGDKGAMRMAAAMNYVTVVLKVFISALVDFGEGFILLFKGMGEQIMSVGKRFDILALQIQRAVTFSNDEVKKINDEIGKLRKEIDKTTGSSSKGLDLMSGAFSGFTKKVKDGVEEAEKANKAFEKTFGIRRQIISLTEAMAKLNAQFEIQSSLADDATLSFEKRMDAMKKADTLELKIVNKQIEIAKKQKELIDAEVAQNRLKFGGDDSVEDLEKLATAQLKVTEAQYKISTVLNNQAKGERERMIDAFETSFKLSRAVADAQRRLAVDGIEDEKKSIDERVSNFNRFKEVILESTASALKSFNDLANSASFGLDLDLKVNENMEIFLGDQRLAIDNAEELQAQLLKTELPNNVIEKLSDYLRDFSLNEKAVDGFSKSVRTLKDELNSLNEDTGISENELQKLIEINEKIRELVNSDAGDENQRKSILDALKQLEEEKLKIQRDAAMERMQFQVEELNKEIELVDKNSIEYANLIKKKTDLEVQIEIAKNEELKRLAEKFKEEEKTTLNELLKNASNTASNIAKLTADFIKSQEDAVIASQNRLIDNSNRMIDSLKASAIAGNTQARESILAEEKAIEESQKRIEAAQKKKARMEFIAAGINTFNSSIQNNRSGAEALGDTAITMSGLAAFLGSLPSFDVGADRLTSDGRGVDNNGGFFAKIHENERIMTSDQNKKIGFNVPNEHLADVFSYYKKGLLVPVNQNSVVAVNDNREVLERIDKGFSKINNWNISVEELFGTITVLIDKNKEGNIHRTKRRYN